MALAKLKERKNYTNCKECALCGANGCSKDLRPYRIGVSMGKALYDCRYFVYDEKKKQSDDDIDKHSIIFAEKSVTLTGTAAAGEDTTSTETNVNNETISDDFSEVKTEDEEIIAETKETAETAKKQPKTGRKTAAGRKSKTTTKK
jgi:hypothetical protein